MLYADVGDSVQRGFDEFATWVPRLAAFIAILIVGYFVARIVARLVGKVLERVGFDRALHSGTAGTWIARVTSRPSRLLGTIAFWVLFVGAISIALDVLGIEAVDDFVAAVWGYIPNVVAALLIFVAAGVAALVARTMGDTSTGRIVGTAAPILIMAIAGFMILDQLMIAEQIVTITYAALVGSVALGMALAFGLGGREVAAEMLRGADEGRREEVKQDLRIGKERARQDAERVKAEAQAHMEEDPTETDTVVAPYEPAEAEPVAEPLLEDPTAAPRRTRSRRTKG